MAGHIEEGYEKHGFSVNKARRRRLPALGEWLKFDGLGDNDISHM